MLRFQARPDRVFLAIVHAALEQLRDDIQEFLDDDGGDPRDWHEWFPRLAPFFAPQVLPGLIGRLLEASTAKRLYQLTDYHWLILYDSLKTFCEIHNDHAAEDAKGTVRVGSYEIGRIDFDYLVDAFFWDTDFLSGQELLALTPEQRRLQLGVSAEAYSIAAGLAPHPDELTITPWDNGPDSDDSLNPFPTSGCVVSYPLPDEDDEQS